MDTLEIAAKMVRDAVSAMSVKFSTLVKGEINAKVSSLYKPGGTATLATLPALTADNAGYVYDMSEAFTTTANFREGAGHKYPAGTNVVVSDVGNGVYKYDVLSGMLDGYVQESRRIGNVPLSADIPVSMTGDTAITVTNTGTASTIGYSITHDDSGVTAGSKGDTTNQTPGFGDTFKVLSATVDAKGHVTALSDHTVKVPNTTATAQTDGLMSKSDKAKLDNLGVTASSPLEITKTGETYNVSLKDSGVTAGSKGDTTNQTPGFGGTFKALSATVDAKGRVTSLAEHNVTIPNATATTSEAGLMSAADKNAVATIGNKVDKVTGKGLSTNDYTTAEKNKLSGIAAEANKTIIDATLSNTGQAADAKTTGDNISVLRELLRRMEIYCEASGNPATFFDADAANIKALSVAITPTQSGSGDPSPDNVRPIPGVSSVTVTRSGENGANPQSVTVQLLDGSNPLTVYGGTLDVTTGELAVTHAAVNLGALPWTKQSSGYFTTMAIADTVKLPAENYVPADALCSHYPIVALNAAFYNTVNMGIAIQMKPSTSVGSLVIRDNSKADYSASDFSATLTGATFVYPLAAPATYQLTPAQLATLSGYNAVSSDAGSVSVTYKADASIILGGGT